MWLNSVPAPTGLAVLREHGITSVTSLLGLRLLVNITVIGINSSSVSSVSVFGGDRYYS